MAGAGRPLVIIHGFGLDHRSLLPPESMIDQMPWRSVYVDLPWTEAAAGSSTATNSHQVAAKLLHEIDSYLDGESFAVLGHSYGGMLARHVAHPRRHHVLGLATIAGVIHPHHADRSVPPRTVLYRDETVLTHAGEGRETFEEGGVLQDAAACDAFAKYILPGIRGANADVMERISADYALPLPEAENPEPITVPCLHVLGRQDDVVGYEDALQLREHYPRGSYVILDAAGHSIHLEQPDTIRSLIRDWLHRINF